MLQAIRCIRCGLVNPIWRAMVRRERTIGPAGDTARIARQGIYLRLSILLLVLSTWAGCAPPPAPQGAEPGATLSSVQAATPVPTPAVDAEAEARFTAERLQMVEATIRRRGVSDPEVLRAMETVPRHRFVLPEYLDAAYGDHPLPIGFGQTISQPYIVALMTELLQLEPDSKVLEIGTGSGYQAAVLAEILDKVYTIDISPERAERATANLRERGYDHVHTRHGDGYYGGPEEAPFDAIIGNAAPDHVPQPLVQQLQEDGGKLVVPIGPPGSYQVLWQITRHGDQVDAVNIADVRFVPLVGAGQSGAPRGAEDRFLNPP